MKFLIGILTPIAKELLGDLLKKLYEWWIDKRAKSVKKKITKKSNQIKKLKQKSDMLSRLKAGRKRNEILNDDFN